MKNINEIQNNGLLWVNVNQPEEKVLRAVQKRFQLADQEIKESLPSFQRPKFVKREGYYFMVLHFPVFDRKSRRLGFTEVDFFLTGHSLITIHDRSLPIIDNFFNECQKSALVRDKHFQGTVTNLRIDNVPCTCFVPNTFMNQSGSAVRRIAQFYEIAVEEILIVHDDLDLPVGSAKLKAGGGHGGHNGLRDLIQQLGSENFHRLRIGIGHPGDRNLVHDYVLTQPSVSDQKNMRLAIESALPILPLLVKGEWSKAMQQLHTT